MCTGMWANCTGMTARLQLTSKSSRLEEIHISCTDVYKLLCIVVLLPTQHLRKVLFVTVSSIF